MPRLGNRHFEYNAKGYAAYRKAKKGMVKDAVRKNPIQRTEVSPSERRQNIRANAQGKSASQLRKKAEKGGDFRAQVLARVLENRSLKKKNPNWRKDAGGSKGLFKKYRETKSKMTPEKKVARIEEKVRDFKANRSEMLGDIKFKGGARKKRKKTIKPGNNNYIDTDKNYPGR
jgi:hypothetical protein